MAYLDRIEACNRYDPAHFLPFRAAGVTVGWLRPDFATRLERFPEVFQRNGDGVALQRALWTFEAASEALDRVVRVLVDDGVITRYHGERYPVTPAGRERALCTLDRAAAPHFGVRAFGQHLNGFVRRRDELLVWVARRARDKWNFPGRLDQMVAGGLPYELSLTENLVKECAEEASLPAALALEARPVGAVTYCQESVHGLKPDVIYTYDLELPAQVTPRVGDGEVEGFELWSLEQLARTLRDSEAFKPNCALVAIDFLVRHGHIDPGEPDYLAIVAGLRRPPTLAAAIG
jgi:8-oxo-dGTP pyrophosphatase MutT (NUDIX family)